MGIAKLLAETISQKTDTYNRQFNKINDDRSCTTGWRHKCYTLKHIFCQ